MPDGGHAAPASWEHVEAVPGMWHTPGTVHVPVARPGRVLHAECVRRVRGVFHTPGTRAGWWACCPHILGTRRSCPGHVPHTWDSACPSRMSRTRSACAECIRHIGGMFHTPGTRARW